MAEFRRPKQAYQGRNGFIESTAAPTNGVISESSRLAGEAKKRRLAEWVLREKGTPFPEYVFLHVSRKLALIRILSA